MAIIAIFSAIGWTIMIIKIVYGILHNVMKINGTVANLIGVFLGLFAAYKILVYLFTPTATGGNLFVTGVLLITPIILIIIGCCIDEK
ncbi:hypothetical protein [Clostridium peptidivorans]|uniref:hypothetical protein n=1 Tax=Clostridium peptidivorans TaxID=100174 RepID=UPI000BE3DDFB|nr:hypothetical protein [Clostridium peptidivorans]